MSTTTTTEKAMTMREFLNTLISLDLPEEVHDFAVTQLDKLNTKNSARSSAVAKKKAEADAPLMEKMLEILREQEDGMLTSELATAMGINSSKVSPLGRKLAEQGLITAEKVKVPGVGERVKLTLA